MRANGLINLVLFSTATVCLMGVVTRSGSLQEEVYPEYRRPAHVLPPDTPETEPEEVDLIYRFKDNDGVPQAYDNKSKLFLEDPSNIRSNVEYDPATGDYNFTQKVGERDYRPETSMSLEEFQRYMFKRQVRDYWRSRVAADDLNNQPRQGMIPKLQVNSELFDRIFGGNTVDIKPTGTAELIFGLNRNKNLNPAIPQRQQKVTNFDFNMRIQLNLIGKIGDKLKVSTNYNTEASFDWENQVKVDYTGYEDEIIKKIEAGNVTLPLNSSLISGSQTLFGFKTEMQFGRLRATTVFSQQKGKKQEITVQGGAQVQQFNINADNYEINKHFFLGHYFRGKYDEWMATLPVIRSEVVITKVEVYVLGINGSAEQTRNVVAFQDLGEDISNVSAEMQGGITAGYAIVDSAGSHPHNGANSLYSVLLRNDMIGGRNLTDAARLTSAGTASNINNANEAYMVEGRDFTKIQNARRLNSTEFYLNPRTGVLSLNQALNNDQALAISYQYTFGGKTYMVGEFSEQVPDNTKLLICKLLKTNSVSVKHKMWHLMMKNVYQIGAYNLNPQDFRLDVYYNNLETGVDMPYLPVGKTVNGQQLIRVLDADRLSVNGDLGPDGVFDFINNYTVLQQNGRIYFPTVEPFGRSLARKFDAEELAGEARKYIFYELYDSTKTAASFIQEKNRFRIKGSYRSSSGSEIALNALNIPQGAVIVTANGMALTENADYTVDYTLGRVKIINESILNSGSTIKVSLESNSLFSVQQKSLLGTRLDYKANRNLTVGSTFLRFNERPLTQKVSIGDEPVSNVVAGVDFNYKSDVPFLTTLLDKLPLYSTKEMSSITARGEYARLFPGNARAIRRNGGNSYIDDFEGSIALIDIKGAGSWFLASVPQGRAGFFKEAQENLSIFPGINRAKLNWYNVDAMFTREQLNTTPGYYSSEKLFSNNMWRQVFETELFPGKTPPNGQQVVLPLLDLAYFPSIRGPYNYDVLGSKYSAGINADGSLKNPASRWGGIMRRLETNDFQAANIEYIQFWLMDPFNEDYNQKTHPEFDPAQPPRGELYINLGNISEDIVRDGRMTYENGIPGLNDNLTVDTTAVAFVPIQPPIINAFSQDPNDRPLQDVGYDGLSDEQERFLFAQAVDDMDAGPFNPEVKSAFRNDPSSDRYHFFRGDDLDNQRANTIQRYMNYNNPEGNSPTESQYRELNNGGYPTGATNLPNIEDINRDNTMSESENYYQYHVKISQADINPGAVGTNFIVDAFDGTADFAGETKKVKWYQFKIPISQFEENVGGIEGFNSIRFMRVYMTGFERPVLLRLARFELVRSDWRRYQFDLKQPGEFIAVDDQSASFDVSAVSLQENSNKIPVNYVMPPEIEQQQNVQTTNLVLLNEQALQMRVCNLKDGDSRAIFKNVDLDTRMFENIKMNVHAEQLNNIPLQDGDLTLFFRVGTDYNNNFYEYEVPLKLTPKGLYDPNNLDDRRKVWPAENEVNLKFAEDISQARDARNRDPEYGYFKDLSNYTKPFSFAKDGYTITIVGNPNLGTVKSIMVGIRNPKGNDNLAHCAEVWINELRLTNFNNKGGWATTGQVQAKLADLGMLSLAGTYKTPFWGSVESKINERSRETNSNWDMSSSINMGKFFPDKWKISLPVYYNFGETRIIPLFSPLDPDVRYDAIDDFPISESLKDSIRRQTENYTQRKGFNLTNVRIDGFKNPKAPPLPWDISNFSATYAYNEIFIRNVNVEYNISRQYRANLQYAYTLRTPPTLKPFAKSKLLQNKWFTIIRDLNLQLLPNSYGFSADVLRNYAAVRNRDITGFYANSDRFLNPTLVNKNFTMNRNYNLVWAITKGIKYDFSAMNEARILEPAGESWKTQQELRDDVVNTFLRGRDTIRNGREVREGRYGENLSYRQNMNLNVDLPLNKIPLLDFVRTTYRFGGTYTWTRRPFADTTDIGNTIQNTGSHNMTANLNLVQLYNKVPFLRKINSPPPKTNALKSAGKGGMATDVRTGEKGKDTTDKESSLKQVLELMAKTLMMVKNVSLTYQETRGQGLPNFLPSSQYMGMDGRKGNAPGFLFTTGLQDPQIRQRSASEGWLSPLKYQTTPYTEMFNRQLTYRTNVEPHGSLRIELTGNRTHSENIQEFIMYDTLTGGFTFHNSPSVTGNFQISTFSFFNTFSDAGTDLSESQLFDDFRLERQNVARELAATNEFSTSKTNTLTNTGYYSGYSVNQQDVLIGAFYRVYSGGRTIKNYNTKNLFPTVPLPNWTITWDGLGKIPVFKKTFKSITVRQTYRSSYNVNGYSNNLLYEERNGSQFGRMPAEIPGEDRNFVPYYTVGAVTMSERFEPLIKFDLQFNKPGWSANVETRRDKTNQLNLTGLQIIETKGEEYIVGIGYLYPKLRFKNLRIQGKVLESNLNIKIDLSFRKNISVIREIARGVSMPTGGTNIITLRSSADYQLTQNITIRLFYDWVRTNPQTSASFPTASANGGFSLRINFQ